MPCETATTRWCRRTPNRSTRCTGTLYCAAFSRAINHWTMPTVGRPVHSGAAIDDTGAKKSSTTTSAGRRRTASGSMSM